MAAAINFSGVSGNLHKDACLLEDSVQCFPKELQCKASSNAKFDVQPVWRSVFHIITAAWAPIY
jgi:hypothetical protein